MHVLKQTGKNDEYKLRPPLSVVAWLSSVATVMLLLAVIFVTPSSDVADWKAWLPFVAASLGCVACISCFAAISSAKQDAVGKAKAKAKK